MGVGRGAAGGQKSRGFVRWIVHIGAPKTGSTAIQRFLFEHRTRLPHHGVQYPDVNLRGYGHHDLAFLLHGRYPDWATPQDKTLVALGEMLRSFVATNVSPVIVLSSENFYLFPRPAELRRFLYAAGVAAEDRISIVCYLRRQDEAHISWYNQTVKAQGNSSGFEDSVEQNRALWDYAEQLKPWQREFGTPAIILRDYSPFSTAPADVRADFLSLLGIPGDAFTLPPARANERINRDILDFQRLVNRLPLKIAQKRRYHKRLIDLTSTMAGREFFDDLPFLSKADRAELNDYYTRSNAEVARRFLNRDDLFDAAGAADADNESRRRSSLTLAKIVFILRNVIFS